ncbi:unnamed protein product [Phytophthora lilii]|uniref:Unnamed protein product n=1 Tax=Phytophthora lilii TaxID=2077276 RepID=A0A9W7D990_9STRA|nr:unnamed protein product [Phytophthora lilii]
MEETTCTNEIVKPLSAEEVRLLRTILADFQGFQAQLHKDTVNKIEPGTLVFAPDDLYPDWDVTGPVSATVPTEFTPADLEKRVEKCLKQKETPVYSGEDDDDIEVYALKMITWYAAYGLYFKITQVDARIGACLSPSPTARFVTKGKEEEIVASFVDCKQASKSLDGYIEEFVRLGNTDDVSEQYKMILFKKGLKFTKLRELLQVREFDSLDDLLDGARRLNPKDVDNKSATSTTKQPRKASSAPNDPKPRTRVSQRCSTSRCLEIGHTADKCWVLHPEQKPQWLLLKVRSGFFLATTASPAIPTATLWDVVSAIQSDLSKIKTDLN